MPVSDWSRKSIVENNLQGWLHSTRRLLVPVRQREEEILHPIPHEVYDKIFDYLVGEAFTYKEIKNIFSNMALVCKFFCSVAFPLLFSSFDLHGPVHGYKIDNSPGSAHFCRDIVQGREAARRLALHVQAVSFSYWDEVLPRQGQISCFGMYFKAIIQMSNIKILKLSHIHVDSSVLEAMHALPRLQCLSIADYSLAVNIPATVIRNLSSLELSSLEFMCGDDYGNSKILADAFDFKNMKILRTNVRELFHRLSTQEEALGLEELELRKLREDDFDLLDIVLHKLPCLTGLYLHNVKVSRSSNLSFSLSPGAIPNTLTSVVCPVFMFPFMSHQPLESLSLSEVKFDQGGECLNLWGRYEYAKEMFPHGSETIRRLEVPPTFFLAVDFSKLFPKLEELHILYGHGNFEFGSIFVINDAVDLKEMMAKFFGAWRQPLMIRRLRFTFKYSKVAEAYWDLSIQREIITTILSNVFPNLEQFSVVEHVGWIRDGSTSEWKPFVPEGYRDSVREISAMLWRQGYVLG